MLKMGYLFLLTSLNKMLSSFNLLAFAVISSTNAGMMDTTEPTFGLSQTTNPEKSLSLLSSSGCGMTCVTLDSLGPPPDTILTIPPPPVPLFLQEALHLNKSNGNCNMCHLFGASYHDNSDSVTRRATKLDDSWIPVLVIVGTGSSVVGSLLVILILKCKKWKIFPVAADSCPILPESFHNHKHASSIHSKGIENEVVPRKVKDIKSLKSNLKHLPRDSSQEQPLQPAHSSVGNNCQPYIAQELSYTPSSSVYTELEASGQKYIISGVTKMEPSPYSVHTYCGVTSKIDNSSDIMQKLAKGCAYDNEAFLASEGNKSPIIQNRLKFLNNPTVKTASQPFENSSKLPFQSLIQGSPIQSIAFDERCSDESMVKTASHMAQTEPMVLSGTQIFPAVKTDMFLRSENTKSFIKAGEMHKRPLPPLLKDHI